MAHSFAKRFNKEKLFNIDCSDFEYYSLEEMYKDNDTVYPVRGIYINTKSLYDDAPVIATDSYYVNFPAHMLDSCKDILKDKSAIADINRGVVGYKIYKYVQKKFNKECYSVEWVDVDPADFEDAGVPELGV